MSKSLGFQDRSGVKNFKCKRAVLATLLAVVALLTFVAQFNEINVLNSYIIGQTPSLTSNSTYSKCDTQISRTNDEVCFSWESGTEADEWWASHPIYEASSVDKDSVCFSPIRHGAKRDFFARLYANQYNASNCENVHTRHMWSRGWGSDFSNVKRGLIYGLDTGHPFQVTLNEDGWHYAALKQFHRNGRPPVCPTKDLYCYFHPMTPCSPAKEYNEDYPNPLSENEEKYYELRYLPWAGEYATRQQMWLRRRVFEFIRDRGPKVTTPCATMHVRRSDIILHGGMSRKYFAIEDYLETLRRHWSHHTNILLLTDDENAVEEAELVHPNYNWMYFNKTRHRGSSGGWENQLPSNDPAEEVTAIIAEHELAQQCDTLVYGSSGYAQSILDSMRKSGQQILDFQVDAEEWPYSQENNKSEEELNARLEEAKKKLNLAGADSQDVEVDRKQTEQGLNRSNPCAPRKGIVVLNLLGSLGDNLFELGFASKMAKELCWGVTYRERWQSTFLKNETKFFPNALLPPTPFDEKDTSDLGLQSSHELDDDWVQNLDGYGAVISLRHKEFVADIGSVETVLRDIRSEDSKVKVLYLNAFFFHDGWIDKTVVGTMKNELKPSDSCCKTVPSEDNVVIHIQEVDYEVDSMIIRAQSGFYIKLLEHYSLTDRPIWVVAQTKLLGSDLVQDIRNGLPNVIVTEGEDELDAFCILTKAKTLVLSHKSTYSQAAAMIADHDVVVHYPIFDLTPLLTFGIESWKYHLVSEDGNGIEEFEVPLDRMVMQYETGRNVQIT